MHEHRYRSSTATCVVRQVIYCYAIGPAVITWAVSIDIDADAIATTIIRHDHLTAAVALQRRRQK